MESKEDILLSKFENYRGFSSDLFDNEEWREFVNFEAGYKLAQKEFKERLDKISLSNEDINSFGDDFEHAMKLIYKELL